MADGITLNEVFVPRVHRETARQTADESRINIEYIKAQLIVLVASTPTPEEKVMIVGEVGEMINDLMYQSFREWSAEYVCDFPELCIDDYDPPSGPIELETAV